MVAERVWRMSEITIESVRKHAIRGVNVDATTQAPMPTRNYEA
jgi:hypothetical protein